jgi:hypothetical protein
MINGYQNEWIKNEIDSQKKSNSGPLFIEKYNGGPVPSILNLSLSEILNIL